MIIRLTDYLERPAIVQQERKNYTHFKITPIGGPAEIVKWREEQAKKLAEYGIQREELKAKKAEWLAGPDAPLGELTWKGKVLLSDQKTWGEKLQEARTRRREMRQRQILTDQKAWEWPVEEPKKLSYLARFSAWLKNLVV